MLRNILVLMVSLVFVVATKVNADDDASRAILLGTQLFKNKICISDYKLKDLNIDCNDDIEKPFVNNSSFIADANVHLFLMDYKPLKYDFELIVKGDVEKAFDYGKFVDALSEQLPGPQMESKKLATAIKTQEVSALVQKNLLIDLSNGLKGPVAQAGKKTDPKVCTSLIEGIKSVPEKVKEIENIKLTKGDLEEWQSKPSAEVVKAIQDHKIHSAALELDTIISSITSSITSTVPCALSIYDVVVITRFDDYKKQAQDHVKVVEDQLTNIKKRVLLSDLTGANLNCKQGEGVEKKDLRCTIEQPNNSNFKLVTLKIKELKVQEKNGMVSYEVADEIAKEFSIHQKEPFVFEVGAEAVYSGLRYPKWGTKEVNGQTVVAKSGYEGNHINAAVTLNIILTKPQNDLMYPALQLGVSTAKEAPAFLVGAGLRFIGPKSLMIAGGMIIAKGNDLDRLTEGAVITGTADLEADLKTRWFSSWYVGLQYGFD